MEEANYRSRQIIATLAVLIIIAVIVGGVTLTGGGDDNVSTTTSSATETNNEATSQASDSGQTADGIYSAEGDYSSPGGSESITVSVTIKDGAITETSAESGATNSTAEQHQADFIEAYSELIVGRSIDDISLSRVAGASLTTRGFNDAIEQIKDQAQA